MNNKIKIYLAGGWFSPNQDKVLTSIERLLLNLDGVTHYFPRHDGVKLKPNELHDPSLRERVFRENVAHIDEADYVVAICDGQDGYYDTGTQWEIGYAMANNVPVIAYDTTDRIYTDMRSILSGFLTICHNEGELVDTLEECTSLLGVPEIMEKLPGGKVLFVGPDSNEKQMKFNESLVSDVIVESHGTNFRWLTRLSSSGIYEDIDEIFRDVNYMIAVIDDRHPIISWLLGQAYKRGIPVITYTNYDYGVNIMLLCSLLCHVKGETELKEIIQKIKREGLSSIPRYDNSKMKAL